MRGTFGQRLARWREAAGLSQGELAGRVGVTPTYICQLEREVDPKRAGEWPRPMLEVVDAIAEALGVPLAEARGAAGYDPPDGTHASGEVVRNTFDDSDFAVLQQMYEQLTTERRTQFHPILEMVGRELELMLTEQRYQNPDGKQEGRKGRPNSGRPLPRRPSRQSVGAAEPPFQHERRRQT